MPGLPWRRHRAPEGPDEGQAGQPLRQGQAGGRADAVCLTCHSGNRNLAFWSSGKHAINEVACSNCHSIHGKDPSDRNGVNLVTQTVTINKFVTTFLPNQSEVCGTCHQHIRAETFKPSHHPIIEGKIKCSDCHNPHGALSPVMLKQPTINDQCYSCHADKRGPFVFNHPPVEENCATCHNPHGSVHYKLLRGAHAEPLPGLPRRVAASGNDLRRGRWIHLPGGDDERPINYPGCFGKPVGSLSAQVNTRLIDRACLNCHSPIHGSNAPANRGKFFPR